MKSFTIPSIGLVLLSVQSLFGGLVSSTPSMQDYVTGTEKLTVYTDVPGHEVSIINGYASRAKSDIYEIRVRSAATDNEWVQCFTNMTYNRGQEMPLMTNFQTTTASHAYQKFTAGWTHTYANIEMSDNSPVEVEIRKIGSTPLNGSTSIYKSAVHPSQKVIAGSKRDENGRVYFTINKPGQLVIDINGQMDDHHAAVNPMPGKPPVHAVTIYANPMMAKPVASPDNRIATVTPIMSSPVSRLVAPDPANYDTLAFGPGVHIIGPSFKVHPGKSYYIPGDAIVYGNFNNSGVSQGSYRTAGDRINIYGYGSICGIMIPHHSNRADANGVPNPEYPEWHAWTGDKDGVVGIQLANTWDIKITGITTIDPANFNTKIDGQHNRTNDQSLVSWVKLHSWRVNGDGCGGYTKLEDSFIRASDDSTYVRDWRRRCTFWKDTNANIFRLIGGVSGGVEDCDIIYARWRDIRGVGNIFEFASYNGVSPGAVPLNITIRNLRFHDRRPTPRHIIGMDATQTFTGVVFENIAFYTPLSGQKSIIHGSSSAAYTELMFKNITFQNGLDGSSPVLLTQANYTNYFETNEYVSPSIFGQSGPGVGDTVDALDFDLESHPADDNRVRKGLTDVGYIRNGTWIAFNHFNFANGASTFTVDAGSATAGGSIELRLASATGTLIGSVSVTNTGGWGSYSPFATDQLLHVTGSHDLYLVFVGAPTGYLFNVRSFTFATPALVAITTSATNGSIALAPPGGTYAMGTVVTLSANPDSGFAFGNWNGDLNGTLNPTTVTMDGNKSVTANFTALTEAVPWRVNFDGLPAGTTSQGAPTTWTATRGGAFRVESDRLAVNGVGGEGVFTSGVIDISSGSVNLSLEVLSEGGLDASGSSMDYVRLFIKVDGGAETPVHEVLGPQAATTWTTNGITGNTLQFVARTLVTAADEYYYLDNLLVVNAAADPFTAWAGAGVNFADDANNDGVAEGMAWFFGAHHPNDPTADLLPKPTGNVGALVLEFDCLNATDRGTTLFEVQYGSDLSQIDTWSGTPIPGAIGTFTDGVVDFVVTDSESAVGLLRVVATIPVGEAAAGRIFGRIKGIK